MSTLSLYLPKNFEEELETFVASSGNYVPVFQESVYLDHNTSGETLEADFIFDNTAFVSAMELSENSVTEYIDNYFYYTIPSEVDKAGEKTGVPQKHVSKIENNFHHVPFHTILGTDFLPAVGRVLDVGIVIISSVWIRLDGSRIVEYSPALKRAIDNWKFQNPGKIPSQKDLFGVDKVEISLVDESRGFSAYGRDFIDLSNNSIKQGYYPGGRAICTLSAPDLIEPMFHKTNISNHLLLDKGLRSFSGNRITSFEREARITNADINLIRGTTTKAGWYVTIMLAELGVKATVQSSPADGTWFYRLSDSEKAYLIQNGIKISDHIDKFVLLAHDKPTIAVESDIDPDAVRVRGRYRYLLEDNGNFQEIISKTNTNYLSYSRSGGSDFISFQTSFYRYHKEFYKDKTGVDIPLLEELKRSSIKSENLNKYSIGFLIRAIGTQSSRIRCFQSIPGSIVNFAGFDIFYRTAERAYSVQSSIRISGSREGFSGLSSAYIHGLSLNFGIGGYTHQVGQYSINWSKDVYEVTKDSYRLGWRQNSLSDHDVYSLKWVEGYEPRQYTDVYRFKYSREGFTEHKNEYMFRWFYELPEDDEDRMFFDMSWRKEDVSDTSQTYTIKYSKELNKTVRDNYLMRWTRPLADKIVTKLYYIKDGDRHHISYMVYGDKLIDEYLLDDSLTFYFSNPSKYELIKFNRDAEPYRGIFMSQLELQEGLNSRSGVPDDYVFIGNYTIEDIDIKNSLSLDVVVKDKQLNEFRSYWLPVDIEELTPQLVQLQNGWLAAPIEPIFRDDHHIDMVELEIEFVNETECCFKQKVVGSRCSPY